MSDPPARAIDPAAVPDDDPTGLLAHTRALTHQVRRAQRSTWGALLVLGVVVLLAIPIARWSHLGIASARCETSADGRLRVCLPFSTALLWYWPVALVAAYAAIGVIFARRARARGVGARVRPYVVGGIALAAVATAVTLWELSHPLDWARFAAPLLSPSSPWVPELNRLVGPTGVIGLGLLILVGVERSRALAAFTVVYLYAVLTSGHVGAHTAELSPWFFLPTLLVPGLVLLAGSALFAVLERPKAGAR